MPHYVLVTLPDDAFINENFAHEHVVHALHGHARALGVKAQFSDAFPVLQRFGQVLDPEKANQPHVLAPGEVVNLVAPADHVLRLHEYHIDGGTGHTFEITAQPVEAFKKEHGFDPRPSLGTWKPADVPDEIVAAWPQHEPIQQHATPPAQD